MRQTGPAVRDERSRSNRLMVALATGIVVSVLGCGGLIPERSTGEKLYRKHCADCHGLDAAGHTVRYMGNPKADLTDDSWKYGGGDSAAIRETVRGGVVELHPLSLQRLDKQELEEIADWVVQLRGESSR